ncbi:MAG: ATP-binding protein [Chloroflexota bacterium]
MDNIGETLKKVAAATSTISNSAISSKVWPGDPNCPHCHGVGYIREDVPVDHPNFGKTFSCSCRFDEIQAAKKQYQREISSLGGLENKTFDNFNSEGHDASTPSQRENLQSIFNQVRNYAEAPRGWMLLYGGYGCGKTHLAAAIANVRLAAGQPVMFVNAPDLLDHLRATFSPGSDITYDDLFERVRNIPMLVIDDLGAENPSSWAQEKLYQILNHRYNASLPTVITTNFELERFDQRIRSRIMDIDLVRKIIIDAPDFRRGASDQTDLSSLEPRRYQTFETFDSRPNELPEHRQLLLHALEMAQKFAEEPVGWLVLIGAHGCGKTHLAAAVANYRIQVRRQPALFITCADLLDHLRATFSPDSYIRYDKRFAEIKTAPLLVLDDLNFRNATPWAEEKLKQLLDYRYVSWLPTVVTTSAIKEDLGDWLETRLLDPRLSVVCPITAPIYRGGKSAQKKRPAGKKTHAK